MYQLDIENIFSKSMVSLIALLAESFIEYNLFLILSTVYPFFPFVTYIYFLPMQFLLIPRSQRLPAMFSFIHILRFYIYIYDGFVLLLLSVYRCSNVLAPFVANTIISSLTSLSTLIKHLLII